MAESHREEIAKLEALYAGNPGGRVFVHLAEAYRKAGEHERARRILDEGLARHTDSASGYVVLGRVLADMQITAEAEIAFRRVLELDGGNLIALRWLGDLARQAGRNTEAAMHYRELLIRNPSNEEVRDLVEIVEREAADEPAHGGAAFGMASDDGADDAFAGLTLDTEEDRDEPAVSPPVSPAEEPAVSPPTPVAGAREPDVTPWSAAPGQTGDAVEAPVEYGVVELDIDSAESASGEAATAPDGSSASEAEAAGRDGGSSDLDAFYVGSDATPTVPEAASASSDRDAAAADDRRGVFELAPEDESDVVSSVGEDDVDVLELDDLHRDDEAEPVEIHLLDPSYEPSGEEGDNDYVGDLDLSDLASTSPLEDADDYADDSFVGDLPTASPTENAGDYADDSFLADLSTAGEEEPPADELPGAVDVMDAALTLLPDEAEAAAEEPSQAEQEIAAASSESPGAEPEDAVLGLEHAGAGSEAAAGAMSSAELAELSGAAEPAAETSQPTDAAASAEHVPEAAPAPAWEAARAAGDEEQLASEQDEAGAADQEQPAPVNEPEEAGRVAEVRRSAETGLMTETMAVLYRSQGFHDRAADVYRTLLRARPGDERLAAKLREAEQAAGSPAGREAAPEPPSEDDAGEVWLRGVGTAWTGPAEVSAEEATPYAWTGEADETDRGEPISSYLQDLVSWKAGSGAWIQPDEAANDEAADDIEMPAWLDGPGTAGGWTPESGAPAYPAAPAAEADWSPPQDVWDKAGVDAVVESSAGASGGAASDEGASDEGASDEATPDEWQVPSDSVETQQASETQAAESGGGWTPFELEDDAAAASAAPPAESPPAGLQPGPLPEEDSSDDDDLEMFRSWLQSLKK